MKKALLLESSKYGNLLRPARLPTRKQRSNVSNPYSKRERFEWVRARSASAKQKGHSQGVSLVLLVMFYFCRTGICSALRGFRRGSGGAMFRTQFETRAFRVSSCAERIIKTKGHSQGVSFCFGDPYGNRTHASALRGPRLSRLTNGPFYCASILYHNYSSLSRAF